MRRLLVVLAVIASAAGARADVHAGGSVLAIGSGPSPSITGELGQRVHADGGGFRMRMGGRFDRVGVELVVAGAGVADGDGHHDGLVLAGPSLAWLPIANRWFQLAARGGLLAGSISGRRDTTVACAPSEDCASKPATVDLTRAGFAVDLGVTAQLSLGARRGNQFLLWADLGTQLARFQFEDTAVSGRTTQLTFGIGHARAF